MHSQRVTPIEKVDEGATALFGAKAAGLARLAGAGFPVPPGFIIPASFYREHLAGNGLQNRVRGLMEEATASSTGERNKVLTELRETIVAAPLREEFELEIARHYRSLGEGPVAVRSSATAEDLPGNSFAGQYDTFLDVNDLAACLEALKACWASLWTERAFDYRERNGFDHLEVDMAVIVQELVPAEAAGVLFTADPVSGENGHTIVEAVRGLGETLVSGKAVPDRFVVSKSGLEVVSSQVAEDKSAGPAASGGREVPCISEDTTRILGLWGMWAEAVFGAPQDLEWAAKNGQVFFLQTRPITTLTPLRSWEERQVWSNVNVGEVLPDVVTPMTWSLVEILILHIFEAIFGKLGIRFGKNPIIGQVAGRAYFNLNTMMGAMRRFPLARKMDVNEVLGGEQGKLEEMGEIDIPDEDIPDLDFGLARLVRKLPSFIVWMNANSLSRGEALVVELKSQAAEMREIDLATLDDGEVLAHFHQLIGGLRDKEKLIAVAGKGMYFFMGLDKVCRRWLRDENGALANQLCSGLEGMESAEAGFELWRLAEEADRFPGIKAPLLAGGDYRTARNEILQVEGGRGFIARWDRFMAEHGHHARGELEVSKPRWYEDDDGIMEIVRGYLASMGRVDPLEKHRRNIARRIEVAGDCRKALKNPLKRLMFEYYLDRAQRGSVIRENIKSEAVRHLAIIRLLLLELAGRLVERDVSLDRDDIFFLELEELDQAFRSESTLDLKGMVASRRAEYEHNLAIIPPKVVKGRFDANAFVEERVDEGAEKLTGLAVSSGIVTGPARVILRPGAERVHPGEVLIAPFTDPGWTPYFLTAAGIVMDMGGLLSHGSIVAREYGIPAVVNVGPATRIIKTGQMVQVDGTRGVVRILR